MEQAGMSVTIDHAGNLRGVYPSDRPDAPRLFIGSHLDTVPRAGAFDGILGVVLGVALIERLGGRRLPFAIEVIGFSEEEGVRFGVPFIGSRALIGDIDDALARRRLRMRSQRLDWIRTESAKRAPVTTRSDTWSFTSSRGRCSKVSTCRSAIVEAISGQSRLDVVFEGQGESRRNHADESALAMRWRARRNGSAWWSVKRVRVPGAVATVGRLNCVSRSEQRDPGIGWQPVWTSGMPTTTFVAIWSHGCCDAPSRSRPAVV